MAFSACVIVLKLASIPCVSAHSLSVAWVKSKP
nr:MAG TPA: hypothetical protein [Caudoviricetes sp.]